MKRSVLVSAALLLFIAASAAAAENDASRQPPPVLHASPALQRDYLEGFEDTVPPAGWTAVVTNTTHTWTLGWMVQYEGEHCAVCPHDVEPQDEWICFEHSIQEGDECLCFWANGSVHWAIEPYQNYNLL